MATTGPPAQASTITRVATVSQLPVRPLETTSLEPTSSLPEGDVRAHRHTTRVAAVLQRRVAKSSSLSAETAPRVRETDRLYCFLGKQERAKPVSRRSPLLRSSRVERAAALHQSGSVVDGAGTAALLLAVRRATANDAAGSAGGRRLTAALPGASGCLAAASDQSRSRSKAAVSSRPTVTVALNCAAACRRGAHRSASKRGVGIATAARPGDASDLTSDYWDQRGAGPAVVRRRGGFPRS
jgi:hypothetical protein